MRTLVLCAAVVLACFASTAVAHADPGTDNAPVECPNTHAHVWHQDQCDEIADPFGLPGSEGHGGACGIICGVGKILGGLGL